MKLDLNDENIVSLLDEPFVPFAQMFAIDIYQEDFDYIVDVIQKDKCFSLILYCYRMERKNRDIPMVQRAYAWINIIVFFDKFYNNQCCPKGCKLVLFALLGLYRDYVKNAFPNLLSERYMFVKRWMETVE